MKRYEFPPISRKHEPTVVSVDRLGKEFHLYKSKGVTKESMQSLATEEIERLYKHEDDEKRLEIRTEWFRLIDRIWGDG